MVMSPNIFNLPDFEDTTIPENTSHSLRDDLLTLLTTAAAGGEHGITTYVGTIGVGRAAINWRLFDSTALLQSSAPFARERWAAMVIEKNDDEAARLVYHTQGYLPRVITNGPGDEVGRPQAPEAIIDASVNLYAHRKNSLITTTATYSSLWGGWNFTFEDILADKRLANYQPLRKEYKKLGQSAHALSVLIDYFAQRS